jgi:glutamate-1-semialdehyde 2,1-aminomutase
MPGGNTRTVLHFSPFPLTFERAEGCRLWDVDGKAYADFLGEYSAGLYGHSNPIIMEAAQRAIRDGIVLGGPNRYEGELASEICARFPSIELVRFCNSGTEANLMALATARAVTARERILVFDGAYHGGVLKWGTTPSPINAPFDALIARYNDPEHAASLIERHAGTIAAILVEPMMGSGGAIPGDREFLATLRASADRHGIVLIFDEVMTSRLAPGGLQQRLGIIPDMTTLGKYLGGGFSFGAFGGRRELMARFDPSRPDAFAHAGTFNNNVTSMAAGLAGLREVFTPAEAERLNRAGDALRERLNETARQRKAPVQVTGVGSIMTIHPQAGPIRSPADVEKKDEHRALIHLDMIEAGQYFARRGYISLSLAHGEAELDAFVAAFDEVLASRAHVLAQ